MHKCNFEGGGRGAAHSKLLGPSAVSSAKMAEPTDTLFGVWTQVGPRKHVLDGGARWRHLATTTELSMCGNKAAFLSNYLNQWLLLLQIFCMVNFST